MRPRAFPNAAHDDQVDATSQALAELLLDGSGGGVARLGEAQGRGSCGASRGPEPEPPAASPETSEPPSPRPAASPRAVAGAGPRRRVPRPCPAAEPSAIPRPHAVRPHFIWAEGSTRAGTRPGDRTQSNRGVHRDWQRIAGQPSSVTRRRRPAGSPAG